jgi:hypothetical protein
MDEFKPVELIRHLRGAIKTYILDLEYYKEKGTAQAPQGFGRCIECGEWINDTVCSKCNGSEAHGRSCDNCKHAEGGDSVMCNPKGMCHDYEKWEAKEPQGWSNCSICGEEPLVCKCMNVTASEEAKEPEPFQHDCDWCECIIKAKNQFVADLQNILDEEVNFFNAQYKSNASDIHQYAISILKELIDKYREDRLPGGTGGEAEK